MKSNTPDDQKIIYWAIAIIVLGLGWWWLGRSAQPDEDRTPTPPATISLLAVGDINLGRQTGQKILAGDTDYPFKYINDELQKPDITFGNLESQLADLGGETQSPTNEYRFAGPPAGADSLKNTGIDIVSIANNHMWDYGRNRLFETIDNLERVGVKYVGASKDPTKVYEPTILEVRKQKVAFLAATDILNGYEKSGATEYVAWADADKLVPAIEAIKDTVDWVVVAMHWGTEYSSQPRSSQVELAHKLIEAGADAVIGGHPHVPQGVEEYTTKQVSPNGAPRGGLAGERVSNRKGIIFYSLGNFAFWQPMTYWTQHSFMANIELRPTGRVEYNPIAVNAGWQPRLAPDEDTEAKILQYIAQLSAVLATPARDAY